MSLEYPSGLRNWIDTPGDEVIIMPDFLVMGDSWVFQREVGQYAAYTGMMTFAAGALRISATALLEGDWFTFTFPGTVTSTLAPQPFVWTVTMTDVQGNRFTVQSGGVQVVQDITLNPPLQTESILTQQLAACDATLLKLLSQQASSVAYAGQTYSLHNLKELWAIRNDLANRVSRERAMLSGNTRSNRIIPRFVWR